MTRPLHIHTRRLLETWWCPWTGYVLRHPNEPITRDTPRTGRKWTHAAAYAAADRMAERLVQWGTYETDKEES